MMLIRWKPREHMMATSLVHDIACRAMAYADGWGIYHLIGESEALPAVADYRFHRKITTHHWRT